MPRRKKRVRPSRPALVNPVTAVLAGQDEYTFQRVCQEAYNSEPGVANCHLYGNRGEKQNGIDLRSTRHDAKGLEVVQCKRYLTFSASDVRDATKEFMDEWPHWRKQKVRRFVLVTSADISAKKVQVEVAKQVAIFRKKKIKYVAWGHHDLCTKLRPHRSAVQQLYGGDGADKICGPAPDTPQLRAAHSFLDGHISNVLVEIEKDRSGQVEELRQISREGRHSEALGKLMTMRQASSWPGLTKPMRARCLRLESSLRLNLGEPPAVAAGLVADAKQLDPKADYQVTDAYLAYRQGDTAGALALVATPATVDAWNTRWAILFAEGRQAEIPVEFAAQGAGFAANAETRRLLALSALLGGDLPTAQAEIARAASLEPKHRGVRQAGAVIDYRSCLASTEDNQPQLTWPTPVPWAFVKRDPESVGRLRRAAEVFRDLRQLRDEPEVEQRLHETWQLACLACDPSRAVEAEEFAQARLKEHSDHFRVVTWAIERDYKFDREAVGRALGAAVLSPKADLDAHLARSAVFLIQGKPKLAEKALDEAKKAFDESGNLDVWKLYKAQFLARRGARITKLLASIGDLKIRAAAQLAAQSSGKGRRVDFIRHARDLAAEYKRKGSPGLLYQTCEVFFRANDFKFIGENAIALVEKLPTEPALRLALNGSFEAGRHQQCLDLLKKHRGLLQGGQLSPELRRLQAACQEKVGEWQEAIKEADALYREKPEMRRFDDLFNILVKTGNTRKAALISEDLLTLKGAPVLALVRAADVARFHDLPLAQELWRKAAKLRLTKATLTPVVTMAFTLGIEHEAVKLEQRMYAGARRKRGKGGLQLKTRDETLEFFRERQKEMERLSGVYNRSEAPIHIIAPQLGLPLVQFYHQQLEDNRKAKNLTAVPALLARDGGRSVPEKYQPDVLYADLTGILLAADLGVLDLIEQNLAPINIAPEATLSLVQQLARTRPHQPSQHVWRSEFVRLVAANSIRLVDRKAEEPVPAEHALAALGAEWHAGWQTAKGEKAVLVAEWPLFAEADDRTLVTVPPELAGEIVNLRELIRVAVLAGTLSEAEFAAQVGPLGVFRGYPQREDKVLKPFIGKSVLLAAVPLQVLAGQRLLGAVSAACKIVTLRTDFEQIEAEEKAYARRLDLAEWIQALLERIQRGIAEGRYHVLPQTIVEKKAETLGLDSRGLGNLLRAVEGASEGALWVDDRMINRHLHTGKRPIIGISEVLRMLQAKDALTDAQWADLHTRLRSGNVRYVPTTSKEVHHLLGLAQVVDGEVVETPALATLRRYYGACGLDRWRLIGPGKPGPSKDIREWKFILELRFAVDEAFREVWGLKDTALETRQAYANWLWRWLYVDVVGIRHALVNEFKAGEERELTAFMVGSLFAMGMGLTPEAAKKGDPSPQESYLQWLDDRLLTPLENSNPGFIDLVAVVAGKDIENAARMALKLETEKLQRMQAYIVARLTMNLPDPLLQKVVLSPDVLEQLKVVVHGPSLDVFGRTYDLAELNVAQAEALRGKSSSVKERFGDQIIYLENDSKGDDLALKVRASPEGEAKPWRDGSFGLLLDDEAARVKQLEKEKPWFDCDAATRDQAVREICALPNQTDRVIRGQIWSQGSPHVMYAELERKLRGENGVSFDELKLPDWRRLLQHLRLDANGKGTPEEQLAAAAESMLREEGPFFALRRAMGLPRRMPEALEKAWQALPETEAADMWAKLPRYARSVVGDLHLVRLAHLRKDLDRSMVAKWVERLFSADEGQVLFDSFLALLSWVNKEMNRWPERHQVPAWQRLAMVWYHATKIHGLLRAGSVDMTKLAGWFKEHTSSWHHGVMDHETAYVEDLSHPAVVGAGSILVNGLGNMLEGIPAEEIDLLGVPAKWSELGKKAPQDAASMTLDLCRRRNQGTDALGAFIAACPDEMRTRLLAENWDNGLPRATNDVELATILENITKEPLKVEAWTPLLSTLRELPTPETSREAMRKLLGAADFVGLVAKDLNWGLAVLGFACAQSRYVGDAALRERLEEQELRIAGGPWRAKLKDEDARHCDLSLLQALLSLSIVPDNEVATASNFFERIARFLRTQPAAAPLMNNPVRHWAVALPFEQQRGLRALWYTVRALQ